MTPENEPMDDGALRDAFQALKRHEGDRAPGFEATLIRGRARRAKRRARGAGIAAVALTAAALFVTARSTDRSADSGTLAAQLLASHGVWRGPTDFLLDGRRDPLWHSTETLRATLQTARIPQ